MSTTYVPKKTRGVARTRHSYKDGGFDTNVDGGHWLGRVHEYLRLPIAPRDRRDEPPRVPWNATAAQTRAWARRLTTALEVFRLEQPPENFLNAWRDFLATCGGYDAQ